MCIPGHPEAERRGSHLPWRIASGQDVVLPSPQNPLSVPSLPCTVGWGGFSASPAPSGFVWRSVYHTSAAMHYGLSDLLHCMDLEYQCDLFWLCSCHLFLSACLCLHLACSIPTVVGDLVVSQLGARDSTIPIK